MGCGLTLNQQWAIQADTMGSVWLRYSRSVRGSEHGSIFGLEGFLGRHCEELARVRWWFEIGGV